MFDSPKTETNKKKDQDPENRCMSVWSNWHQPPFLRICPSRQAFLLPESTLTPPMTRNFWNFLV